MRHIKMSLVIGLIILVGCSTRPSDRPSWIPQPKPSKNTFFGVGQAVKNNHALSKVAATERARAEIARAVENKVSTMLKDFIEQRGAGKDADALEWSSVVTKTVSSVILKSSVISDAWYNDTRDGVEYWVKVEYPLEEARKASKEVAERELKRREGLRNRYFGSKAIDELNKELDKMDAIPR